jgi:mycofactocin precursor
MTPLHHLEHPSSIIALGAVNVAHTTLASRRHPMATANPTPDTHAGDDELLADDLIEEVSIDGMCGVY